MKGNHTQRLLRTFGATIKQRREELGISQEELADRAGLHRTYVSDIERGARNVALANIVSLAAALDLKPSTLLKSLDSVSGVPEQDP